jgi:hypothetical protein
MMFVQSIRKFRKCLEFRNSLRRVDLHFYGEDNKLGYPTLLRTLVASGAQFR